MADLNIFLCTGRLGRDPELRHLPNGDAALNVSIAVGKKWKDKASGETKEQTTWVRCSMFGKTAELMCQYAKKGTQVRITGELQVRKFTDKDGAEKESTEIRVSEFQLLGGRPDGAAPASAARPPAAAPAARQASSFDSTDSDIPF